MARESKPWVFGIVFKSTDPNALERVREFILREGGRVVYSTGPTEKFLWILSGANPSEGKGRDAANRGSECAANR
jgi:hypothetical protein